MGTGEPWRLPFASMLLLSLVIAVAGLLADSATLVIGAMLIAPLMTPVLAFAVALAMGWPRHLGRAGLTIVVASAGSVAMAWGLTAVLRGSGSGVTAQILGRTSPGVVDMVVALAAGAAGAYATAREDVSAALPGVAVAVALVPPLATIGVALELGRPELARGALLLYVANLVAIVAAGVAVFVASGFVPTPRLAEVRRRVLTGGFAVAVAVLAVSALLSSGVRNSVDSATTLKAVNAKVLAWLGTDKSLKVRHVTVDANRVTVDVEGSSTPPPSSALASALVGVLGQGASAQVRWSQGASKATPGAAVSGQDTHSSPNTRPPEDRVRRLVRAWLDGAGASGTSSSILSIVFTDDRLHVEVGGPFPPPPAPALAAAVAADLGRPVKAAVRWTPSREEATSSGIAAEDDQLAIRARAAVKAWAVAEPGIAVLAVTVTDRHVTVDLAVDAGAPDVAGLDEAVKAELGTGHTVLVRVTDMHPVAPPTTLGGAGG